MNHSVCVSAPVYLVNKTTVIIRLVNNSYLLQILESTKNLSLYKQYCSAETWSGIWKFGCLYFKKGINLVSMFNFSQIYSFGFRNRGQYFDIIWNINSRWAAGRFFFGNLKILNIFTAFHKFLDLQIFKKVYYVILSEMNNDKMNNDRN